MVGYDSQNNALTLGDDDSLKVGEYELQYDSTSDEFQAEYDRPIGGELGNHGDILGAEYTVNSIVGNHAIAFDSDNDKINTSFISTTTDSVTVSAWIYPKSFGSGSFANTILDAGESSKFIFRGGQKNGSNVVDLVISVGGTVYSLFTGDGTFSDDITLDEWTHVAGTYDGTTRKVYVDGTEVLSNTNGSGNFTNPDRSVPSVIGEDISTSARNWDGLLDEILVYNTALSPSQITDLSNKNLVTTNLQAQWSFEYPETPNVAIDSTGEVFPKNSIPRSTSGSLVPQGFADVVSQGEVLADNGEIYTSVQTAVDNSAGFVFVGPGTFNEQVSVGTTGLTIEGSGDDTLIDGETSGNALDVVADNVTIRNLSVQTTAGGGSISRGIRYSSSNSGLTLENITVRQSDEIGLYLLGSNFVARNCKTDNTDSDGIRTGGVQNMIVECTILNADGNGIRLTGREGIIANNTVINTGRGIDIAADDSICIGNRVINSGNGLFTNGVDNIFANNRVSDSTEQDIQDNGTGTVLDDNLKGQSN